MVQLIPKMHAAVFELTILGELVSVLTFRAIRFLQPSASFSSLWGGFGSPIILKYVTKESYQINWITPNVIYCKSNVILLCK